MLCSPGITIIINIIIVIIITVGMILLADANDDDEVPVGEYAEKEKERLEASWRSWGQDVPPGSPIHRLPSSFFEYYYEDDDDGDHDVDDGVHLASTHSVLLLPLWKDPTCIFAPWGNPLRFFSISSYDEHRLKMSQKNKAYCAFPSQDLGDISNKKTNCPWISAPGDDIASKQEWLHVTCVCYIRVLSTGEMMMMMIATFKKINVMTLMMMMMTAPMRCNPCMLHLHGVLPNVCYTCMGYMAWLHLPV